MKDQQKFYPVTEDMGGTFKPEKEKRKMSGTAIFFLCTTILLLIGGAVLLNDDMNKKTQTEVLATKVDESEARYTDLDGKYSATIAELESYKGRNAELDKLLTEKENMVKSLQATLSKEKKSRGISDADYKKKLEELNQTIADLGLKVDALQQQNVRLTVYSDSLGSANMMQQASIVELKTENTGLTTKVTIASLLVPENLEVSGSFVKAKGREVISLKASKTDQLRVCFDVPENKVADAGKKTFFIRVINPEGTVLAIQDQGSGIFSTALGAEQRQFTLAATIDYDQTEKNVCVHWGQKTGFAKGNYAVEIYQDGYQIATKNFELK